MPEEERYASKLFDPAAPLSMSSFARSMASLTTSLSSPMF